MRRRVVLFIVLMLTLAAHGEQREQPLFVMVLQPLKAGEAPFDVAKLGGKLEHRSGSRLAVRLPEAALEAVERNPQVRYIQRVWLGVPAQQRGPSNMSAAMSMAAGPVAHSSPSWTTGVYTYDGSGNVASIISSTQTNTYAYDHLGRLAEASVASGGTTHPEAYAYDVAGNLTQITQGSVVIDLPVEAATNRLTPSMGVQYDAAGHMIQDPLNTWYRYDQLGMIADDGALTYVYNADDERIGTAVISGDWNGVTWHWTLRDGNGRRIRQFDSFGGVDGVASFIWSEDEFHDGQRLVAVEREEAEGGRRYFHQDHLGTTRLTTNSAGQVISGHDYYPFGTEITSVRQERVRGYEREQAFRFTGHERDGMETYNAEHSVYLDYMHARYYNPNWGRFLSVDPSAKLRLQQPQSWNRYAYSLNNPLKYVDPDGRDAVVFIVSAGSKWDQKGGHSAVWVESGNRQGGVSRGGYDLGQGGWQGFLEHYTGQGREVHAYILKTTDAQDQAMLDFLDKNSGGGVDANKSVQTCGLTENCASAVVNVLQAGGVVPANSDPSAARGANSPFVLKNELDNGQLKPQVQRHIDFVPPPPPKKESWWSRVIDRIF